LSDLWQQFRRRIMAREEDKARSVRPITSGSLNYEAGTVPGEMRL